MQAEFVPRKNAYPSPLAHRVLIYFDKKFPGGDVDCRVLRIVARIHVPVKTSEQHGVVECAGGDIGRIALSEYVPVCRAKKYHH